MAAQTATPSPQQVKTTIRDFLLNLPNGDRDTVAALTDSDDLNSSGAVDSLSMIELIAFLEEDLHIFLDTSDLNTQNFKSIESIADMVLRKIPKKAA